MACSCSVLSHTAAASAVDSSTSSGGSATRLARRVAIRPAPTLETPNWEHRKQKCENARQNAVQQPWTMSASGLPVVDWLNAGEEWTGHAAVAVESTPPPPRQKKKGDKGKDYHVNVGYAIRSLREELPGMFYREPTFDIYREDIVFRDPLITFSGIRNYKLLFWGLRFYGRLFFKAIWIEIHRIWQPSDKVIMVRWTVHGIPRVPWEARGQFDATSEYKLDPDGLIYEHRVDNLVMNSPPKYKAPAVIDMVVAASPQAPATPSFIQYLAQRFTWIRFYVALTSTLACSL